MRKASLKVREGFDLLSPSDPRWIDPDSLWLWVLGFWSTDASSFHSYSCGDRFDTAPHYVLRNKTCNRGDKSEDNVTNGEEIGSDNMSVECDVGISFLVFQRRGGGAAGSFGGADWKVAFWF